MKTKLIIILVCTLLIATVLPTVGTMNDKEISTKLGLRDKSSNYKVNSNNIMDSGFGGIFFQLPYLPNDPGVPVEWASEPYRKIFEDFTGVSSPICDIHWWGEYGYLIGSNWVELDPELMRVNILFYNDDNGQPGTLINSFIDVKPSVIPTGLWYDWGGGDYSQLYYFQYDLDPCVNLKDGWVSISNVVNSDQAMFLWMISLDGNGKLLRYESNNYKEYAYDVSLVFTDGQSAESDLEGEGKLSWTNVKQDTKINGSFQVKNNGDANSILHWKIDENTIPSWGNFWVFTPNASVSTPDMGWLKVDVEFYTPDVKNKEFTGKIKVVNVMNSSDYYEIDVICKTPRIRTTDWNLLLMKVLERFPILERILNL